MNSIGHGFCCTLVGVALCALAWGAAARAQTAPAALPLIPVPAQVTRSRGDFEVTRHTVISVPLHDAKAAWTGHYLARMLARTRGLHLRVRIQRNASPGSIRLQRHADAPVTQSQGYALEVNTHGIEVRARSAAGLFYGAVTVWQLLTPNRGHGPVAVPYVAIRDWPRFAWRGLMLDSARHMQSVAGIKRLLNQMALHKLDVFHWHLTDDQGWRLQIKRYPKLTSIGGWRTPPGAGTHGEPRRYGGFYTQAQIRAIVAYAAARHITVEPEIDMPGHAQAAVASYPDVLGVTDRHPRVAVDWGVNPYLYSVSKQSLDMLRNIMTEELKLFPSTFIHVGGDEAIKDQWKASPFVQKKIRTLGLKNEDAMQSWFIGRIADFLTKHHRRLIGWDEILEGGLPANAAVESWHGTSGAVKASSLGHDAVLAPQESMYFDHLQSDRSDEPSGRFPLVTLATVYALNPAPDSLDATQKGHVLGAEAALWTEFMNSRWEVEHAIFPRIDALAELAWSPQSRRTFHGFLTRLPAQLQRYRALGIDAAGSAFAVNITLPRGRAAGLAGKSATVALANQTQFGQIHYTINGSRPTFTSRTYTAPVHVTLPVTIRAAAYSAHGVRLAPPSTRRLDTATLRTRNSSQLQACRGQQTGVRLPLLPDLGRHATPDYNVDLFASCWIYPKARLNDVTGIRVDAARLPRNQNLAHAQSDVVAYPNRTPAGELEVHLDSCKGPLIADIDLPHGKALGARFKLAGAIKVPDGIHNLCLRFTAPVRGPLYAIGAVHLLTATDRSHTPAR